MQAWVFRHLDQLRSIYGTQPEPRPEDSTGADGALAMAPGTTARRGETGPTDVILAPMGRPGNPGARHNR